MELSGLQAAFSEAKFALDAIRASPRPPSPAALQHFDYAQADIALTKLRRTLPSDVFDRNVSPRQPRAARRPISAALVRTAKQRTRPRSDEEAPGPAAIPAAPLPADPFMSAHAASVPLMDLAAFRMAVASDVAERIRTAPLRPTPTILPPGPQQAARPAPRSSAPDGGTAGGSSGRPGLGSSAAVVDARHTAPDGAAASRPV